MWRLTGIPVVRGVDPARLPANSIPVLVDLAVTVGDADLQNRWLGCKIMLSDPAGRSWAPTATFFMRASDDVMSCNSAIFSGAKSGEALKIREPRPPIRIQGKREMPGRRSRLQSMCAAGAPAMAITFGLRSSSASGMAHSVMIIISLKSLT